MNVSGDTVGYLNNIYSQLRKTHFRDITQATEIYNERLAEVLLRRFLPAKMQAFGKQVSSPNGISAT